MTDAACFYHQQADSNATVLAPHVTMIESAVRLMFGYGYGFNKQLGMAGQEGYIPKETLAFASREYQYMRFGFAFTMMQDGYFTHEIGDSWHGQDWYYDEERFDLGRPLGLSFEVNTSSGAPPPPIPPIVMPDFNLWVNSAQGVAATLTMDSNDKPPPLSPASPAASSARVFVSKVCHNSSACEGYVELEHLNVAYTQGQAYSIEFWAKTNASAAEGLPIAVTSLQMASPYGGFGFPYTPCQVTQTWTKHVLPFSATTSTSSSALAKISFLLGATGNASIWIGGLLLLRKGDVPTLLRRNFECGVVFVNGGDKDCRLANVEPTNLAKLDGQQAPKWQYTVDDNSASFVPSSADSPGVFRSGTAPGDWTSTTQYEHGYNTAYPTAEENVGPYYHQWEGEMKLGAPGASASFSLEIPERGVYNVSLWWPRAMPAMLQWSSNVTVTVGGLDPVVLDQTQSGDRWVSVAASATLDVDATLRLQCGSRSGRPCVADAVLVESQARYNDGARLMASTLTVRRKDGVVLRRMPPPPGC